MKELEEIVTCGVKSGASDIHISAGEAILFRIDGQLVRTDYPVPSEAEVNAAAGSVAPEKSLREFETAGETDFACTVPPLVRMRCNYYHNLGRAALALRLLPLRILSAEELGIPEEISGLCDNTQGLVLVTGATGSGKSTTLAALLDYINRRYCKHIVTLEDPVEYIHQNRLSMFHHREVGKDTASFASGIRSVLRQDPDVIMVGEMRDLETIATAVSAAEAGHLVLATLHANCAAGAVDRILDAFPGNEQRQIRVQLADSLRGVVSQTLVPRAGGGRTGVYELLVNTNAVQSMIREEKTCQIPSAMQSGKSGGMLLFDEYLIRLARSGIISSDTALDCAKNRQRLESMLIPSPVPVNGLGLLRRRDDS